MNVQDAMRDAMRYCFENWPECQICGSPFWWVRDEKDVQGVYHCHFCPDSKISRDPETGTWSYVTAVETKPVDVLDMQEYADRFLAEVCRELDAKIMAHLFGTGAVVT